MQLLITMTGEGARFKNYSPHLPKPFIEIQGKAVIAWILSQFPFIDSSDVIFLLRADHLRNYPSISNLLRKLSPEATLCSVESPDPRGPVLNILKAESHLKSNKPILVSYCDYFMLWDHQCFLEDINNLQPEGIMPCYTGFHPHLIHEENLYACAKVDDKFRVLEIKEKFSFTVDKTKSFHSPGLYYYQNAELMLYYFKELIKSDLHTQGEFFCSLAYNLMIADGLKVMAPPYVEHFCQWGTPKDLNEYLYWIKEVSANKAKKSNINEQSAIFDYWMRFYLKLNKN